MSVQDVRIEVTPLQTEGMRDVLGDVVQRQLFADHGIDVGKVRSIRGYLIRSTYSASEIEPHVQDIFQIQSLNSEQPTRPCSRTRTSSQYLHLSQ